MSSIISSSLVVAALLLNPATFISLIVTWFIILEFVAYINEKIVEKNPK